MKILSNMFVYLIVFLSISSFSAYAASVNLGTASNFAILSKSGITDIPTSSIIGDVGTTPITGAAIGVSCTEVTGTIYDNDGAYTGGFNSNNLCRLTNSGLLNTARIDMEAAYTAAAGLTPPSTLSGDISGMTLTPGIYKRTSGLLINKGTAPDTNGVTLDCQGNTSAVFIFQITGTLTVGSGAVVTLKNGCRADNIFWQVAGTTTLGTTSVFNGNILDQTNIAMLTGSKLCGRTLAQTAVTLDHNYISNICGAGINSSNFTLTNITLSPISANLTIGSKLKLNVTCLDQLGLPIASSISYASSNPLVVKVNSAGLVTAVASGSATINATCGGVINATSMITVKAAGSKSIPVMDNSLFILLMVFTVILGLYGFKKYGR